MDTRDKPRHLGAEYAAQFADASIVAAYVHRPPYPEELFECLAALVVGSPRLVLELGAGSGHLTFGLAERIDAVDAVEPSVTMRAAAKRMGGPSADKVRWSAATAESFVTQHRYGLAVAAESLHWMEWDLVLPKLAKLLRPNAPLAIVTPRVLRDIPWEDALRALVARHSTNRDYARYDLIEELTQRGLFCELGRRTIVSPTFTQNVEDYIESFHSRNGFSRDRMTPEAAASFDEGLRALVARDRATPTITSAVSTTVVWGLPLGPP
jgi:SAM-dependent methyltransferase